MLVGSWHRLLLTRQPLLGAALRARCYCAMPAQASLVYEDGLPRFRLPLPSRSCACQFTLKPLTNSVGDLARCIKEEDRGLEMVAFFAKDGARIAGSDPVSSLLRGDFEIQLNDLRYAVAVPEGAAVVAAPAEGSRSLAELKSRISQLYTGLNVQDFQLERERRLLGQLEELRLEIQPMEDLRLQLADKASRQTRMLTWLGLSYMGLQFGILARLTWWEYSWDIMEPVIYFVVYGTVMASYAYYVVTKQEYTFPQVWDREYLKKFYSDAGKANLDIAKYNGLRERISDLESKLSRLRDPLMPSPPQLRVGRSDGRPQAA